MATAALVGSDIEIGRRIVAALTRAHIPVTVYLWAFIPQLQEWQFIIATPLVDSKGPRAAYGEVNKVLEREGIYQDVPLRRVFLRSPSDRTLKLLEKESKLAPREAFRVVNAPISGSFVEDAYVYSGSIHVVRGDHDTYSIVYFANRGAALPTVSVRGTKELRTFLEDKLHLPRQRTDAVMRDLAEFDDFVITNVELRPSELRRLGLA